MKLIDGKGQLGKELLRLNPDIDCTIYHTWNLDDKSNVIQFAEHLKFCDYVDAHSDERIVFVSTVHSHYDAYFRWKMKSELYLWGHTKSGLVIRIQSMIGKGRLYDKCLKKKKLLFGNVVINTIKETAEDIIMNINSDERLIILPGHEIDVNIVNELIQYGVNNDKK